ncbi:lipopolysaccharide biosynthesis protein [Streptomyces sp. NEAU-W12]|uniref:lipopolysaccharide biosynthesis protein n=1 Tax=Streptomyces sp. NEAU-W12 TaxID=2994668 RepID=UPI00224B3DC7|nr:lipopolysaccharide biosynthesis protein [Streptomyces sp. NEAU-W12]MCX2926385.1 lipopolysaccharide biosynthesis protein [Streptomyces sp. NEAU-W12]
MTEIQVHEPAAVRTGGRPGPADRRPGSDSLFKNAYFLMLSTGVSAVLGLGFWLVAARYYSEDAVGQGSAAIAAMRLLASITATTMIGAVVRFVPRAGRETGRLVWGVYGASSLVVALAAGVFLLTLDLWGASYEPLGTPLAGALFVAACVAWALLTLQDGVLTGLRKTEWVPAGNAVFSTGKLVLLAVFASALPVLGIFVSWAVAIAFSTLPLGWLIFRRLIPRQAAADRDREPPGIRAMGCFLAGDSLGALFSLAMINLLPVMVAVRFSAAENGYFYVAYTVGGTMEFMAINMAASLTAHASHDPRRLADGVRGALRRMTLLLVPVVLVLVAFAPLILTPFSADYAEHGSTVLRLLALGALPRVVVELYIGVLRVQGRTGVLAVLQGAMCVLVLGSAAVLFTPAGIAGAGWAVLTGMTVVAAVSVFGLRSALRVTRDTRGGHSGPGGHSGSADRPGGVGGKDGTTNGPGRAEGASTGPVYGTRWAKLNATAGYGTGWARRAAYEDKGREQDDADTVTLFIGTPGYEREALQADTMAFIVRLRPTDGGPQPDPDPGPDVDPRKAPAPDSKTERGPGPDRNSERGSALDPRKAPAPDSKTERGPGPDRNSGRGPAPDPKKAPGLDPDRNSGRSPEPVAEAGAGPGTEPGEPPDTEAHECQAAGGEAAGEHAEPTPRNTHAPARDETPPPRDGHHEAAGGDGTDRSERRLRDVLWGLLGLATVAFWASTRPLHRFGGPSPDQRGEPTGRQLLEGLPLVALAAGGVLLLVFVAAVTLCTAPDPWLPGTALGSALLALYAAPVALGWEPSPVGGAVYVRTAGLLADATGTGGPEPLLRWTPQVCQLLCLVALWLLLERVGGDRLSRPGRWGVVYLVAVAGWVGRDALAPVSPPLLAALLLLLLLLRLPPLHRAVTASRPPGHRRPNG